MDSGSHLFIHSIYRSIAMAAPSWSQSGTVTAAAALMAAAAFSIATASPANCRSSLSFSPSPTAAVLDSGSPRYPHRSFSPVPLFTSFPVISRFPEADTARVTGRVRIRSSTLPHACALLRSPSCAFRFPGGKNSAIFSTSSGLSR